MPPLIFPHFFKNNKWVPPEVRPPEKKTEGIEFPKKRRSRPINGTKAPCSRGATHVQRRKKRRPPCSCCGERPRMSPSPLLRPSSPVPCRRPLSAQRRPSLSGGVRATHAPLSRCYLLILAQKGRKVKPYTVKGVVFGFNISLQSRSPRAKPWMSISAVPTLVA